MPILAQPNPHAKRRRPWLWVLLGGPGMVLVLLLGLVAWSWDHPRRLGLGGERGVSLYRSAGIDSFSDASSASWNRDGQVFCSIPIPSWLGGGYYGVLFRWID